MPHHHHLKILLINYFLKVKSQKVISYKYFEGGGRSGGGEAKVKMGF
jgi:hypothetical protein